MNHDDMVVLLLRISCVLSIIGSMVVMGVCSYSQLVDRQKGKQLIFWLSVADLGSSVVYLMSTLEKNDGENTSLCKTFALLGIFFPVASFLWTDFIAYYLWTMIVSRKIRNDEEWNLMMRYFHAISWGVSALCIVIVGASGHAGRGSDNDADNTGGWCWVRSSDNSTLIIWELIGGKFVEWTSCFIIVPYFYYKTAAILMKLDNTWSNFIGTNHDDSQKTCLAWPCQICTRIWAPTTVVVRGDMPSISSDTEKSPTSADDLTGGVAEASAAPEDDARCPQQQSAISNGSQQVCKPKFWKFYTRMVRIYVYESRL